MRIKNKELKKRRQRKEQIVKAAQRELRAQFENRPKPVAAVTVAPKAKAPKKESAPKAAKKEPKAKAEPVEAPTEQPATVEAAEKPKRAPKRTPEAEA